MLPIGVQNEEQKVGLWTLVVCVCAVVSYCKHVYVNKDSNIHIIKERRRTDQSRKYMMILLIDLCSTNRYFEET